MARLGNGCPPQVGLVVGVKLPQGGTGTAAPQGSGADEAPTLAWAPNCGSATCLDPNGSVPKLLQMENCRGSAERLDLRGRDRGLHARVLAGPPRPFRIGR